MPRPILYSTIVSQPCRAVLLTADSIGLELEVREVSLMAQDQLKNSFTKINPQHTVPTLDDNGDIIWDSHAIMSYLVGKYGKNDDLYPKDLTKRALVDQRLHFDSGILFALLRQISYPIFFDNVKTVPEEKNKLVKEGYDFLNIFLEGKKWLAGDSYTLADISCVTTLTSLAVLVPIDSYPNIVSWVKTCEDEIKGYARLGAPGNTAFHEKIQSHLQSPGQD
ncbi:glutathione S-transferase 1-1-like [Diachasmimorpha longicaudata]|uniref:glutathione S-transferase 1-1-like n=1 Tax=Diachasmimorpha longicaudata TaxID=58733 RepID=UPI0030B8B24D